jgi:hypothetical protein
MAGMRSAFCRMLKMTDGTSISLISRTSTLDNSV